MTQFTATLALARRVRSPTAFETLVHFFAVMLVFWSHICAYGSMVHRPTPNILLII